MASDRFACCIIKEPVRESFKDPQRIVRGTAVSRQRNPQFVWLADRISMRFLGENVYAPVEIGAAHPRGYASKFAQCMVRDDYLRLRTRNSAPIHGCDWLRS